MMRNYTIDCLRGWAIFLVVWGHSIQCLGEGLYESMIQPVVKFIYMFHMPLFFFISGYFPRSMEYDSWEVFIKRKALRLLVPALIWAAAGFFLRMLLMTPSWSGIMIIKKFQFSLYSSYWFINVLLMCLVYGKFLNSLAAKQGLSKYFTLLCGAIVLFFIPEVNLFARNIKLMKFFFPFFALGWACSELHVFEYFDSKKKLATIAAVCCVLIMGGIYIHKGSEWFAYQMQFNINKGDSIIALEMFYFLGVIGIVFSYCLIKLITNNIKLPFLSRIGKQTLGIYLIQGIIFNVIFRETIINIGNSLLYFLTAVMITASCSMAVGLMEKNKFLSKYLLGK